MSGYSRRRDFDGPRPMGQGVQRVMKHLRAPRAAVVQSVFSEWSDLVGEVIGSHARPVRIVDGTLYIEVDDQAWASELSWMADELVTRISERLGTTEITAIRVALAR
ncbi:MAG: DciA family protein [Acidimicrobiales bacterium]